MNPMDIKIQYGQDLISDSDSDQDKKLPAQMHNACTSIEEYSTFFIIDSGADTCAIGGEIGSLMRLHLRR